MCVRRGFTSSVQALEPVPTPLGGDRDAVVSGYSPAATHDASVGRASRTRGGGGGGGRGSGRRGGGAIQGDSGQLAVGHDLKDDVLGKIGKNHSFF